MTMKEIEEKLVDVLKRWQKIEDEAVLSTEEVVRDAKNPILQSVF